MTKFIVIASGKGGVGKTTTAINLASAFLGFGREVILVDANLSTPNVGIYLGAPKVPVSLHDVLEGKKPIGESIYIHRSGLKVVPASISLKNINIKNIGLLSHYILSLAGSADIVIIDTAAGLGSEALHGIRAGDDVIIITTPDLASVTDALKTVRLCEQNKKKIIGVLVNRAKEDDFELAKANIEYILEHPVLAMIPDDDTVRQANHLKSPVTYSHPQSSSSIGYKKLAAKLLGEKYVESIEKKEGMLEYALKRIGINP
ncbi:MAG: cell division ATPase MinD [archaeon]